MAHEYDTDDTTQAQALDIEAMKDDMQAGTSGDWSEGESGTGIVCIDGKATFEAIGPSYNPADVTRISRVRAMEARIIRDQAVIAAADNLLNAVDSGDRHAIGFALAAYRAARKEADQ